MHRPPVLRGRRAVVDDVMALVAGAAEGAGGALTIVGEPGIGKTAVLDEVAARIGREHPAYRLVRIAGVEAEMELAWSGLGGLLGGLLDGLDRLPPARASAVRAALAMEVADEPAEPFAIALATRDLLVNAAEQAPMILVVDDLPWVDPPTRGTLAYISRRLEFERVAVVSTRRAGGDAQTDTGPTLVLNAVPDDVADSILTDAGVGSAHVRRQLVAAGGGIPLVLVEAANMLDDDQRSGRTDLPDPLPIGPSGQRIVDLVLAALAPPVLRALVVAAAEPGGDRGRIQLALEQEGLGAKELETAEERGVVALDDDRLVFRHPLMRTAAYHDAPRADRRAAHRALAATLPAGSPVRAWHLARAAAGPDEEVARALDEAAAVTARRGAPAVAARSWELASRLSPEPEERMRRLRLAATAVMDAGMASAAGGLLDRADAIAEEHPGADDLIERLRRQQLRSRLPPSSGGTSEPVANLRVAAREVATESPTLAVDLLLDVLAAYIRAGAFDDMASVVRETVEFRDLVDDDRARRIDVLSGALQIATGQPGGQALLDRYLEISAPGRSAADVMFLAEILAPSLGFLRRTDASDALLADLEADLRRRGAVRPLVSVLGALSIAHYGRSFPATLAAGTEAITLAESDGSPELASLAAGSLVLCAAVIGDRELCERSAALLGDAPEPERRALGSIGLAYLAFSQGRLADADALYRRIEGETPIGKGLIRWETEWIETLARAGRRDEAQLLLQRLEAEVAPSLLRFHGIGRALGMLATDDDTGSEFFADAIAAAVESGNPFAEGRTQLAWGERLRRSRQRGEARVHLQRAVDVLRRVGATSFADRAVAELRAAGGVVDEDVPSHQLLTPHELQVARLVVGGASNRDLAATLFISPRTVEAHLTSIFRKLGVRNRRELAARALRDPVLQP